MRKAVLISIRPKWCELIASGKKTLEIRKTRPKLKTPFKCYIYETRGFERVGNDNLNCVIGGNGRGMVIGEFSCSGIVWHGGSDLIVKEDRESATDGSCVSREELFDYLGIMPGTRVYDKKCEFYGWHISDLMIYDEPKKLSEFRRHDPTYDFSVFGEVCRTYSINRPPQSWCYVEVLP